MLFELLRALSGVHLLIDKPLRATTSGELAFLLLVTIRLWWLAQRPALAG